MRLPKLVIALPAVALSFWPQAARATVVPSNPYYNAPQNLTTEAASNNGVTVKWDAPQVSNYDRIDIYVVEFYKLTNGAESGGWAVWTESANHAYTFGSWIFDYTGNNLRFKVKAGSDACVGRPDPVGYCLYGTKASVDRGAESSASTTTSTTTSSTTSSSTTTTSTVPPTTTTEAATTTSSTTVPATTTTTVPITTTTQTTTTTSTTTTTIPPTTTTTEAPYPPPQTTTTTPTIAPATTTTTTAPATTTSVAVPSTEESSTTTDPIVADPNNLLEENVLPEYSVPETTTTQTTSTTTTTTTSQPEATEERTETGTSVQDTSPESADEGRSDVVESKDVEAFVEAIGVDADSPISDAKLDEILIAIEDATPEQVVAVVFAILSADVSNDQIAEVASNPEVLAVITEDQAEELFENLEVAELSAEQLEVLTEAVQFAPTKIKQKFEGAVNIFGSEFESYVPTGSNIPVSERRVLVAVGALLSSVPVAPIASGSRSKRS